MDVHKSNIARWTGESECAQQPGDVVMIEKNQSGGDVSWHAGCKYFT